MHTHQLLRHRALEIGPRLVQVVVMNKTRLEAFSDGVIAILITIMVLELKIPHEPTLAALAPIAPVFLSYVLSYIFIGIYWSNHHHMLHAVARVNGTVLWANLHLLFWLSLVPFTTAWMGENHFAALPVAAYGAALLGAAIAYTILQTVIINLHGNDSKLAIAVGKDFKGKVSMLLCAAAIPLAFVQEVIAECMYILVALIWLVPDRRIEAVLKQAGG
jgi:uncharacterized membrane protein